MKRITFNLKEMRITHYLFGLFIIVSLVISACSPRTIIPTSSLNSTTPQPTISQNISDVVDVIRMFVKSFNTYPSTAINVVPPSGWSSGLPINPHPDDVRGSLRQRDKIYIGLRFAPNTTVTFSRYTFMNKGTGKETEIGQQETGLAGGVPQNDFGPFDGEILLFVNYPLSVPSEAGKYEFRIYIDKTVVASAMFEVVPETSTTLP